MILAVAFGVCVLSTLYWLFIRTSKGKSLNACCVSKAHLTCDPGDRKRGYNNVVCIVRFTEILKAEEFWHEFEKTIVARESAFRRCMRFVFGAMSWEDPEPDWSPRDNFNIVREQIDGIRLEELSGELLGSYIDLTKPCWHLTFYESVTRINWGAPSTVIMLKYHHAMADGFTMIQNMIGKIKPVAADRTLESLFPRIRPATIQNRSILQNACSFASSAVRILIKKPDAPGVFRDHTSRRADDRLSVALGRSLTLSRFKNIARLASAKLGIENISVNDVVTAIFSIAFRMHAIRTNPKSIPGDISTVVWVSLSKELSFLASDSVREWDNSNLGFAYCQMPLSESNSLESLRLCHKRLDKLKSSADAVVINTALKLIGSLPVEIGKAVSAVSADTASVSMSNLPGPNAPVYWPVGDDQATDHSGLVEELYFISSPPFHLGPLVSIISYCGELFGSLSARESVLSRKDLSQIINEDLSIAITSLENSLS